ncbi:hypothetical protein [Mesorhizobium sp. 131-2-1]|uniref:hypothetical protein n=1 Tax=Mesorhizobium sp. 131-2-1 TaxID=2744518 RepID=UPI0019287DFA|nr:hypothetical protein [Mesorhizobium sp. 131-2-1]BCG91422.1 hypothetical protein MesoLj131a_02860 [Mesorhizobium sp. 131-2-1]
MGRLNYETGQPVIIMPDLARIKSNVAKMAAQGAPEQDIDGYIASEGVTVDDVRNFKASAIADADARAKAGIERAKAVMANGGPQSSSIAPEFRGPDLMGSTGTLMASGAEGVPIIGGVLDKGVLNASAGLGALFSGQRFSDVKNDMQAMRDAGRAAHPYAHLAGNMAGAAIATAPLAATSLGAKAFGLAPGMSLPARMGASALTNGTISGADTAARGGDLGDIAGSTAIGAGLGGIMPVAAKGVSGAVDRVAGWFNPKPAVMGVDDLTAAAKAAYERADQAGVAFNNEGVNALRSNIIKDLTERAFDPVNEPGVMPVIRRLEAMQGNVTLKGLDTLRKVASNGFIPGNKSNNVALTQIISRIDELVTKADPSHVMMGDAKAGAFALQDARKFWSSGKKLEIVNELLDRAGLNAGSTGAGGNVENATRQQLKRLLTNPSMRRGLTADEQAAARKAVLGSKTQNALRLAGKLSPQGNGLMLAIGGAGTIAAPATAIPAMVAGYGAKKTAEYLSRKSVGELVNLIAQGGDKSTLPVIKNAVQLLAESKKVALARALTVAGYAGTHSVVMRNQ